MKLDRNKIIVELSLKSFGAKGWHNSNELSCPNCGGRGDKMGIYLPEDERGGSCHCFRCDSKFSLFKLLKSIDRLDLWSFDGDLTFNYKDRLEGFLKIVERDDIGVETSEIRLPLGFKFITSDEYLNKRGFLPEQYSQFNVGTSIEPRHRDKVVFLIKEDSKLVGYISRSKKSKEWHKENMKLAKEGKCKLVLRYDNSEGTDFEKLVGGIDEVIEGETHTVILVEGIMDKSNTDTVLELNSSNEIKCCFTFGCKLSDIQSLKLLKKGVENIILLFDPETISQTKSASLKLSRFFNIFISEIKGDRDPGVMNEEEFNESLSNLKNPIDYFSNRLSLNKLK